MNFKKNRFLQKIQIYMFLLFVISSNTILFSQSIDAPLFIGSDAIFCAKPQGVDSFGNIIPEFNTFNLQCKYNGVFNIGNTFVLEMSDASGSFVTPTVQATSIANPPSPSNLTMTVPSNFVGGLNYKFRIRSTSPVVFSPISVPFSIHYLSIYWGDFQINNNVTTATICGTSGITLSITKPTVLPTSLKYIWKKNNIDIANETSSSILVTSSGSYLVEIDYGLCNSLNTHIQSQPVSVNFSTGGGNYLITSSNGNIVTAGVPTTLSTPIVGVHTYKWYKDNVVLIGETNNNLITDLPGVYELEINDGNCISRTNSITLSSPTIIPHGTVISNLVSPNGDGNNDTWIIPDEFIIGTNTTVMILDSNGKTVLKTDNYNNDFPQDLIDFESINPVFYYIITPVNGVIKKGTITIVK